MIIEVEGLRLKVSDLTLAEEEIHPGELYVGKRNQGWKLASFRMKSPEGWVYSSFKDNIYPYDDCECRRVIAEVHDGEFID